MSVNVSIVIPVYNAERFIGKCLRHIMNLEYDNALIDVFVVDNGSSDDSVSIVKSYNIPFSIEPGINISAMRNLGVSNTKGQIVAFVDSDCFVDKKWIGTAVKELMSDGTIGIIGSYYSVPDNPSWVEKAWYDLKREIIGEVAFLSSGNMLMRRDVLEQVGGFTEGVVTGEDYELCQKVRKAGYKVVSNPSVKSVHMGNVKTLMDIIRKERWYGLGMVDTAKHGEVSKPLALSIVFILLMLSLLLSLFFWRNVTFILFLMILFLPLAASYYLTRNVSSKRLICFIKCIPISLCYIVGRTLSVMDRFVTKTHGQGS